MEVFAPVHGHVRGVTRRAASVRTSVAILTPDAPAPEDIARVQQGDALVLSACVQMPSLAGIALAEEGFGLPVLSAATATAFAILSRLGLTPYIPDAGFLLAETRKAQELVHSGR